MTAPVFPTGKRIVTTLLVLLALALSALTGSGGLRAEEPLHRETLHGEALVAALRSGGHVLYFRHAATDWSQQDRVAAVGDWTSCDGARVRQLSDAGRATARQVGAAMRRLGIPVGRVYSSEYCRAAETARLLDVGEVVTTRDLMNMRAADLMGGREQVIARARRLLSEPPLPGTNTVLVAHGNLMRAATGVYTGEAGAGVFRVMGKNLTLVAELTPQDWQALAEAWGE
jgi:broad specificity phosphatase PhoE